MIQKNIQYLVSRVRRNHGLEHASLHVLSGRFPRRSLAGYSDPNGFWLVGDLPTESVSQAVSDALHRMQLGEKRLALHPNCGTNFLVAGILAGLAGFAGMYQSGSRVRDKLERLPVVMMLATLAIVLSQPLGYRIQESVTTSGDVSGMQIVRVEAVYRAGMTVHRVTTAG